MDHFTFQHGELYCEAVPVSRIVEEAGTPAYIYSAATLRHHYDGIAQAFATISPIICYSIKSCANVHVCRLLRERGAGFDVVSGGELVRAKAADADMAKIVYAGVGKTDDEIRLALNAGIGWFNVESEPEMENLIHIARDGRVKTKAALRVNPDVDPKTHRYTTTGKKESKFGVDLERARRVFEKYGHDEAVRLCGIHLHIGSPVNTVAPYVEAISKALDLIDALRKDGYEIDTLDIGGGFGADYETNEAPGPATYAEAIVPLLSGRDLTIILEPGRSIAANAGILASRVLYRKSSGDRDFLIADAGMNDLLRPSLYEAFHFIWPVRPSEGFIPSNRAKDMDLPGLATVDVVGPVCETGDFFAKGRSLPPMRRGDLLAVFSAGAYGMTMSSNYNSRLRPPEVLVEGDTYRVIRQRETYEHLLAAEGV